MIEPVRIGGDPLPLMWGALSVHVILHRRSHVDNSLGLPPFALVIFCKVWRSAPNSITPLKHDHDNDLIWWESAAPTATSVKPYPGHRS